MILKDVQHIGFIPSKDACRIKEVIHPQGDDTSPGVSLAWAEVMPGRSTSLHRLDFIEIYYILEGCGRMHVNDEAADVIPGQAVYVPRGAVQYIENRGQDALRFLCICHPAYDSEGDHLA